AAVTTSTDATAIELIAANTPSRWTRIHTSVPDVRFLSPRKNRIQMSRYKIDGGAVSVEWMLAPATAQVWAYHGLKLAAARWYDFIGSSFEAPHRCTLRWTWLRPVRFPERRLTASAGPWH